MIAPVIDEKTFMYNLQSESEHQVVIYLSFWLPSEAAIRSMSPEELYKACMSVFKFMDIARSDLNEGIEYGDDKNEEDGEGDDNDANSIDVDFINECEEIVW